MIMDRGIWVSTPPALHFLDSISAQRKFTEVSILARPSAELGTQPTMGHQAETSSTLIAELRQPHPSLNTAVRGLVPASLGKPKLFKCKQIGPAFAGSWSVRRNLWPRRLIGNIRALQPLHDELLLHE